MWTSLVPLPYRIAIIAALFAAATGFGYVRGISHEADKRDLADAKRAKAEESAIFARVQSNTALAVRQQETNRIITKAHDEELAPVLSAIAVDRVRIGPALCGGPATTAKTESPGRSDAANSVASAVHDAAERDFAALKADVATSLAAGRSCQAFVRDSGMAPISE